LIDVPYLVLMAETAIPAGIGSMAVMWLGEELSKSYVGTWLSYRMMILALIFGGFWGIVMGARFFPRMATKRGFWPPLVILEVLWLLGLGYMIL